MPQKRMECFGLLFDHLAWIKHQFLSGIRDSRKAWSMWGTMRGVRIVRKSIDQSWLAKGLGLGLGLLCWEFMGVQGEIPWEKPSTLQIGCGRSKEVNTPDLIGQRVRVRVTMLRFKGVQEEIRSEEVSTLQIGSVAFPSGQSPSPQLHPCHWLFDQDGHQDGFSASL